MRNYLHSFNAKYDNLKLYVLLYPYKDYIENYKIEHINICINTNDGDINNEINEYIKKFFTKNIIITTNN